MAISYVENTHPLIHCITNPVSMNDCANILLACGASPIMAEDLEEVEDITCASDGLCLNLGMLNERKANAMLKAGLKATERQHPILLDPVGVGASLFRLNHALLLLEQCKISVIRANASEIKALVLHEKAGKGVDVSGFEEQQSIEYARRLAKHYHCIVVMTGKVDLVTNGNINYFITNGDSRMAKVTGAGCMLSSLMTAFIACKKDDFMTACVHATSYMGLAGEFASKKAIGCGSFRTYLVDAIDLINDDDLKGGAKVEVQ